MDKKQNDIRCMLADPFIGSAINLESSGYKKIWQFKNPSQCTAHMPGAQITPKI